MKIEWNPALSVGDPKLDGQHQAILEQIKDLVKSDIGHTRYAEVRKALSFLDKYIKEHLSYEEDYMKKHGFPKLEEHKKLHEEFIKFYEEFKLEMNQMDVSSGSLKGLTGKAEKFLGGWWMDHIGNVDKQYYEFIKNKKTK